MKQLHPRAVWLFLLERMFWYVCLILPLYLFTYFIVVSDDPERNNNALWGILSHLTQALIVFGVLIVIYSLVYSRLAYHFYRYELGDVTFSKKLGIIWRQDSSIPYNRIQNVDVKRGIIDRLLGLSELNIHTAGVGGSAISEGRLPGLSKEVAEQLRDELIVRARSARIEQSP